MSSVVRANIWQNSSGTPYGTVLQVVQAIKTDTFSSAFAGAGNYIDIPGLSLSITPVSASSRILIFCNIGMVHTWNAGRDRSSSFKVFRNNADTRIGDASGSRQRALFRAGSSEADSNHGTGVSFNFVDVPNTTSALTYKLSCLPESGATVHINRSTNDENINESYGSRVVSTLIAMEIQA